MFMEKEHRIEEFIKTGHGKEEFLKTTKKYFVNTVSNSYKIHITGYKGCPYSKSAFKYIDFDTEEAARGFFNEYDIEVTLCGNCKKNNNS